MWQNGYLLGEITAIMVCYAGKEVFCLKKSPSYDLVYRTYSVETIVEFVIEVFPMGCPLCAHWIARSGLSIGHNR